MGWLGREGWGGVGQGVGVGQGGLGWDGMARVWWVGAGLVTLVVEWGLG